MVVLWENSLNSLERVVKKWDNGDVASLNVCNFNDLKISISNLDQDGTIFKNS